MSNQKGFAPLLIIILIALGVGGYFVYTGKVNLPQKSNLASVQEGKVDKTTDWKTYTNYKFGYQFNLPKENTPEKFDAEATGYRNATGQDERVGIYLDRKRAYSKDFFELQIDNTPQNSVLKSLIEANYKEDTTHFQIVKFTPIKESTVGGNPSFEYTFTGQSLKTHFWSGSMVEAEYKVIFTQKNNLVYSFYFTNNELFNNVLSSFKFIQSAPAVDLKSYINSKYKFSVKYPTDWNIVDVHTDEQVTFGPKVNGQGKPPLVSVYVLDAKKFKEGDVKDYSPFDYKITTYGDHTFLFVASTYQVGEPASKETEAKAKEILETVYTNFRLFE